MSTYWGYACTSHEPHLESEHWFNHGQATLIDAYLRERAGEWPSTWDDLEWPMPVDHRGYTTTAPIHWLREHPHCEVVLRNEYGDERPIGQGTILGDAPSREIEANH